MATTENKYKLLPATKDKLELIKNYAKGKDDWWIEKQIDILEVLIKLGYGDLEHFIYKDEVLKTNIWDGEEQYHPTQKEVNFIYNYLQTLLVYEIDRTKKYYQENEYRFNQWLTND